MTPDDVLIFVL